MDTLINYNQLANRLMQDEPARSAPFMEGLAAVLQNRVDGTLVTSPYSKASVDDDAYFAGRMRAHNEFRNALINANGNRLVAIENLRKLAGDVRRVA